MYERSRTRFGRPIHDELRIEENGGGVYQRFENGIITYSDELGKAFGILRGAFLDAYLDHDAAMGEWGFIAGNPKGRAVEGNRLLEFQHGRAEFDPDDGVRFIAR
ncbi:MAG: hypothetical protein QM606_06350 [Leucobacter sp.]